MSKKFFSLLVTMSAFGLLPFDALCAQAASTAENPYVLEAITVTADKREESIQEIPASVSAVSAQEIKDSRIRKLDDIANQIPNVTMQSMETIQPKIHIRGLGSVFAGQSVTVNVDGVPLLFPQMLDLDMYDLERIEVLRGPQGTLYGANALAGVINIITNKPTNDFHWGFEQSVGNYNASETSLYVRGPIIEDKLYFSFAGGFDYRNSYFENALYNKDHPSNGDFTGRLGLRYTPTEELDIALTYDGKHFDGDVFMLSPSSWNDWITNSDVEDPFFKKYGQGLALDIDYSGAYFDITSISAYRTQRSDAIYDGDGGHPIDTGLFSEKDDLSQLTQELRFSSNNENSNLQWLVGAFAYNTEHEGNYSIILPPAFGLAPLNDSPDLTAYGLAVFGEGTYTFFDKLDLTFGLRVAYDNQELDFQGDIGTQGLLLETNQDRSDTVFLPKAQLAYHFTDDLMTYALISRGYKSGYYNRVALTSTDAIGYAPEYNWNYELGLKSSWLDNRLIFNATLFYMDITDYQATQILGPSIQYTQNAGKAENYGLELETRVRLTQGLDFIGGFAYTHATYKEYIVNRVTGANYDGNRPAYSPKYTYNAALEYALPLLDSIKLFGKDDSLTWISRAEINGFGDSYHNDANTEKEDAYNIVNFQTGFETENYSLTFWVANVFEEKYRTIWSPSGQLTAFYPEYGGLSILGTPRTFGATFRMDF